MKYFHAQQRNLFITEKEIYEILDPNVRTVVQCMACDERTHPDGSVQVAISRCVIGRKVENISYYNFFHVTSYLATLPLLALYIHGSDSRRPMYVDCVLMTRKHAAIG